VANLALRHGFGVVVITALGVVVVGPRVLANRGELTFFVLLGAVGGAFSGFYVTFNNSRGWT
jgi:hypothetical protein